MVKYITVTRTKLKKYFCAFMRPTIVGERMWGGIKFAGVTRVTNA